MAWQKKAQKLIADFDLTGKVQAKEIPFMKEAIEQIVEKLGRSKVVEPIVSSAISIAATGVTEAVSIPAGAYVFRVGLLATVALANADVDVGDGDDPNRFIDGVTTLTEYDMLMSGVPANPVAGKPCGGHYYAAADTIDLDVNTASTGTVKVLAWYHK